MCNISALRLLVVMTAAVVRCEPRHAVRKFPDGFLFGTSTSAYQVEGAWNVDGKAESIWDRLTHTNASLIRDQSNGDIAANSYYLSMRDVQMMRELGLDFYRFSVSWPRVLPTSFPDKINEAGVKYYNDLIDELLKYNIQPMLTLFQWDLPQKLQDLGGWTNPESVTWFGDYARTIFRLFGDRVKNFITINEPFSICNNGLAGFGLASTLNSKGIVEYICAKNILLAHAKAYHIYNEEFRPSQKGNISISLSAEWYEPASDREEDVAAAHDANQFNWAAYSWPIFSESGDFPPEMKKRVAEKSEKQGFPRSRLPELTLEEIDMIKRSSDFFGLNHYPTQLIYCAQWYETASDREDVAAAHEANQFNYVPWGFRKLLNRIKNDYGNPPVIVTENGVATFGGIHDDDRVQYYRGYLDALLDALEDGCDVRAYTAWSLMDNFEWTSGYTLLVVVMTAAVVRCGPRHAVRKFPDGFLFGTSTSAYQVEGAWNVDGKAESIWDRLTHTNASLIRDQSNGDIAANSYYLYKRDVQMLRELGLDFYRFSVSWSRVLPTSFPDKINEAGVKYYNDLIDELLKYNIQPMLTLYHFDLPQKLQDLGGWTNPKSVTWFGDYARTIFRLFGDRVKSFITINEPFQICNSILADFGLASALNSKGIVEYMCAKNILLAHAKAYHIYNDEFRPSQKGNIFISLSAQWHEPASDTEEDVAAAHDANQFNWAPYSWPIFSENGDFPPEMKKRIAEKSEKQGFHRSRLPEFTLEEIEMIKGSSDFFGLNHYFTELIYRNESIPVYDEPSYADDLGVGSYQLPEWQITESSRAMYVPWGFRKLLNRIKNDYGNPPVIVTENGVATFGGIHDDDRVQYYRGYLDALLDALEDGCDVRAYTAWSLMDNFEWTSGYTERFGLYEVDYDSIYRTRTPRKSAYVCKELLRTRALDHHYEPDLTAPITIDSRH